MQRLKIQQLYMQYNKDEYSYDSIKKSFIKKNEISSYPDDCIVEEFEDCWVVKSKPIELIGEVIRVNTEKCKTHFTQYQSNITSLFVAYDVIGHNTKLFGQTPSSYQAAMYNNKPIIKTRFTLYNVIIQEI